MKRLSLFFLAVLVAFQIFSPAFAFVESFNGNVTLSEGVVEPFNGNVAPSEGIAPFRGSIAPSEGLFAPFNGVVIPPDFEARLGMDCPEARSQCIRMVYRNVYQSLRKSLSRQELQKSRTLLKRIIWQYKRNMMRSR